MAIIKVNLIILVGIAFVLVYLKFPRQLFLYYILIKPIVDRFAESAPSVGGVPLGYQYIAALAIPSMSLVYVLIGQCDLLLLPHKTLLLVFVILNILSFLVQGNYTLNVAGYFIRAIFPLCLFFAIPFIISERGDLLRFIRYTAIAGLFPCVMIVMQKMGVIALNRQAQEFGGHFYNRATGGYADSFTVAMPIILSIFCIYFLLQYTRENGRRSYGFWFLLVSDLICLAFTLHRMSFVVVALVSALWSIINKRITFILLAAGLIVVSLPILIHFIPGLYGDFYVARHIPEGTSSNFTLQISNQTWDGRIGLWRHYLEVFDNSSLLQQIVGIRMAGRAPHNDYLRILLTNGVIGLFIYLALLLALCIRLSRAYIFFKKKNDPFMSQFALTSSFVLIFYVVGSTTLAISLLSSMSWYLWIFAGITYFQLSRYGIRLAHFEEDCATER